MVYGGRRGTTENEAQVELLALNLEFPHFYIPPSQTGKKTANCMGDELQKWEGRCSSYKYAFNESIHNMVSDAM